MNKKPILLLDFDGVLHQYITPWTDARTISDPPVPGALEFLVKASSLFEINIYSSRSHQHGGRRAMKRWLRHHYRLLSAKECVGGTPFSPRHYWEPYDYFSLPEWWSSFIAETAFADPWWDEVNWAINRLVKMIKFPKIKPPAHLTIDDRCFHFQGTFPTMHEIEMFRPWNRKDTGAL